MAEDNYDFKVMSINIRGINDRKKRRNVFRWVKKNKIDICLLQETYSTAETATIWRNEWGRNLIQAHGTNHSKGVMLLIRPGLDEKINSIDKDIVGRTILADLTIQGTAFKILNIYAPNTEEQQVQYFRYLRNLMKDKLTENDKIIMGGDFNFVPEPQLDRKGGVPITLTPKRTEISKLTQDIKEYMQIQDLWRIRNPETRRFTWRRTNPSVKSRLDYWLTSTSLADHIEETDIVPFCQTDHSAILLKLKSIKGQQKGRGYWKMNNSFLSEEPYVKGLLENKTLWVTESSEIKDARVKWELIKYRIRQYSMKYGKQKAQNLKTTEEDLERKLKSWEAELDQLDPSDRSKEEEIDRNIADARRQLEEIADYKTKGLILRSQARWYEQGEKSTKYFLQLETRNKIKRSTNKLKKENGTITTDATEILKMQAEFYDNLYKKRTREKSKEQIVQYLSNIQVPKLDDTDKEYCEGLLTVEECEAALKTFKKGKSPGNDGITAEFYKKFWFIFGKLIVDSFNTSHRDGELSSSQRQAVITLLDKGKDRTLLKNWRPISLLNVDYKIASKAIANRFTHFLPKIINSNQVGYIKGRNIIENIRTIADLLEHLKDNNLPGVLVNIDFEKAFDSVNWKFLFLVLKKFNFGTSLIKWIEMFYTNITSCIINNGHASQYFNVERGVRQGDPLSPYLFILVVEIMAAQIRQEQDIEGLRIENMVLKLLQYADDTNGLLKDEKSAEAFLRTVKDFGSYSGLRLNTDKTEAMWLGSYRNKVAKPLGILWPNKPLRILGVHMSYDKEANIKLNFEDRIDKAKQIMNMWRMRNLTLYGKGQIIRTFIISQFLFVSSVIETPPQVIKAVNSLIYKFIWKNKKDRIKRKVLISETLNGGLNIPDFETMIKTARYKWVRKLEENKNSPCYHILQNYLKKIGICLDILLYANFSLHSVGIKDNAIPKFYYELLKLWSETGNTTVIENSNFIWYNRAIRVESKSVLYPEFLQAGIWYKHDLFNPDGSVIPFDTWINRGLGRQSMIKWMGLIDVIRKTNYDYATCVETSETVKLSLLDKGELSNMRSKDIYRELLSKHIGRHVNVPKIVKYLDDNEYVNWKEVYFRASKIPIDTKTKDFQYRFCQDILVNRYWLHKWKIKESPECMYCKSEPENLKHMFWTCVSSQTFWQQLAAYLEATIPRVQSNINMKNILLGTEDEQLCNIIFAARMFIYNRRINVEEMSLNGFKMYMRRLKDIEFQIAKEKDSTDTWHEFSQLDAIVYIWKHHDIIMLPV